MIYDKVVLSEEQLEIVQAPENQIAVIGPPGTGKTRVLTERVKYLLEQGVPQNRIVAITFTNFAANEMRSRLPKCDNMFIGTMHSYAAKQLTLNGYSSEALRFINAGDFNNLIRFALTHDIIFPEIDYLFVDEVQDLCDFEFEFIGKLNGKNIFYGGDADQCIYQFKGAKPNLFNDYCRMKNTKLYILTHNFRCGQNIIDFSKYFMKDIKDRIDIPVIGNLVEKGWVQRTDFLSALNELCGSNSFGNWFILTRTNAELEKIAEELTNIGIPFSSFKQGDFTNDQIKQFLKNDEVKLLTIHSAKGLEADNVIVVGARNWGDNKEEKCIEYVAATRARKLLFWCPTVCPPRIRKNENSEYIRRMATRNWN